MLLCSQSHPYQNPIPIFVGIPWEFIPTGTPIPMYTSTLAIMSSESDILREIDSTVIISDFSVAKLRNVSGL